MPDTARLFVAAQLPDELKKFLLQTREEYANTGSRLLPEQNLHLTLFFIGNVPVEEVNSISQKLAEVTQQHLPFTLTLEQLEPGPKPKSPRLIWARFYQHQVFEQLCRHLTKTLTRADPEHQKFIPHVTLARFKKEGRGNSNLSVVKPSEEVLFPVSSIALWQSQLASPHPIYSVVNEFPLIKN